MSDATTPRQDAFFEDLGCSREVAAHYVDLLASDIANNFYSAYLQRNFGRIIGDKLQEVLGEVERVRQCADALGVVQDTEKYHRWTVQLDAISTEVREFKECGETYVDLGVGKRKQKHFISKALPMDSAVMAVGYFVGWLYQAGLNKRHRKTYHEAGLLFYLNYEKFDQYLYDSEVFPTKLATDDELHRAYSQRRRSVKSYLSEDKMSELRNHVLKRIEAKNKLLEILIS